MMRVSPWKRLNRFLYRSGVRSPLLRRVLRAQTYSAVLLLSTGMGLFFLTPWIFWVGVGAMLSLWNFFSLTKSVPHFMVSGYTRSVGMALFLRSQGRLLCIVAVAGVCVVTLDAPIGALLTGFSIILAIILLCVLLPHKHFKSRAA